MDVHEKLSSRVGEVLWSDLAAHAARDAVIVVADELDLVDVGAAVAGDEVERVGAWIAEGKMAKPRASQLARWAAEPDCRFVSLIVSPFVLVHPLGPAPVTS